MGSSWIWYYPFLIKSSKHSSRANYEKASLSTAQITFSPGPSYSIGIASGSSISSSSTGALYFQLSAPTSYQWVALGIGKQMSGSTIFVMYQDGNGNVTISGRKASGQSEPKVDSTIQGGLELLEGSGVSGGNMIANVRCGSSLCIFRSVLGLESTPGHRVKAIYI